MTKNQEIAQTILAQLGGRVFTAMTGARDMLAIENGLQIKLPANFAKEGINCVRVLLEPSDTYAVEFGKVANRKGTFSYSVKSSHDGVYVEQLTGLFEQVTGLSTRM